MKNVYAYDPNDRNGINACNWENRKDAFSLLDLQQFRNILKLTFIMLVNIFGSIGDFFFYPFKSGV